MLEPAGGPWTLQGRGESVMISYAPLGGIPGLYFAALETHVSWPVIAIAAAAVIVLVLVVAWIALTASRRGSRHGSQPRPARGRHQGAHARRPRLSASRGSRRARVTDGCSAC